ncbi:MAG: hypothetical protein A3J48_03510 [Candidatus Doudnabacteria bacterium RIFCSPHIGHO2_02_FULL_46_11]|uniref:50S ribosomal protein L35 n=1 Tax=Candidatus Doudnabacteria bacterium RIFCSPHIGHO2_02_FULL_46_11 TaxID=1817832 RepID=A0A1F5P4T6_9BACT|nr:MAG: hypothetical protein A3J48_03510 [Candidatus Doudnabacteria bacterium RIFCSPHIGHO2_02_FULL_46_11]
MRQKTHKGATKRFWKTGSGKLRHRSSGQDHFNSRESGNTTRKKRKDANVDTHPRIDQMIGR